MAAVVEIYQPTAAILHLTEALKEKHNGERIQNIEQEKVKDPSVVLLFRGCTPPLAVKTLMYDSCFLDEVQLKVSFIVWTKSCV